MTSTLRDPRNRWQRAGEGERYSARRWSDRARAERDPRLVAALLADRLPKSARILDAPCGTGRLRASLAERGRYVGLDISEAMLRTAITERAADAPLSLARGDLEQLPFPERAFDAVVCCRLLHHLREPQRIDRTVAELVRVSRRFVVASFWDAASASAWRRRLLGRSGGRCAHSKARIQRSFETAGTRVVAWQYSLRFLSPQTFVLAERVP